VVINAMEEKVFKLFGKVLVTDKSKVSFLKMNEMTARVGIFVPEQLCYSWLFYYINTNVDVDNPNSVPSVKLMESLKKLQAMTFKWTDLKNRYQNEMAKYFNPIADGLTYISNINSEIVRAN
jgi:hypothetical protein